MSCNDSGQLDNSNLQAFLDQQLKLAYVEQLVIVFPKIFEEQCYGCCHNLTDTCFHNVCCLLPIEHRIKLCFPYALQCLDETKVMESYGNKMGLASLEWLDVFDANYRRGTWMCSKEWWNDVLTLLIDSWPAEMLLAST